MKKTCAKCGETKDLTDFYKDSSRKDGIHPYCKVCKKLIDTAWLQTPAGKAMIRNRDLKRFYGITLEDYNRMFDEQSGLCAICRVALDTTANVDHDHKTDNVRGLLCRSCNLALGHFQDSKESLKAAIRYLEGFE